MDTSTIVILILIFLGLSAFFSASEMAYFTLQRVRVQHLAASGTSVGRRLAKMKEEPERFLATVLLANNLVNTALSALATALAISFLGEENRGWSVVLATAAATVGIVVLGEAVPKTLAARHPEPLARLFLRLWEITERVLFPMATLLRGISRLLTWPFQPRAAGPLVSEEELRSLVRLGAREGTVEEAQAEMIHKVFRLGNLRAGEIMTPRTDIVWVQESATLAEFLQIYAGKTHTRFPVYQGGVDNVRGVLYTKDVLKALAEGRLRQQDTIAPLLRSAHFYPESKPVDDLFQEMRAGATQMAMLVDEHGGIAGLVTMKRILGEVVGPMAGEEEVPELVVETIDERTLQVDAGMRVEEANERLGLGLPEAEEYDTLAGFVLHVLGHIPREGEQVRHHGLRFTVMEMKGVKIEKLLVRRA